MLLKLKVHKGDLSLVNYTLWLMRPSFFFFCIFDLHINFYTYFVCFFLIVCLVYGTIKHLLHYDIYNTCEYNINTRTLLNF
ncbi:hypothetical protein QVD17_26219 [Tagetes erecta]|uniref:Uncharacterized protein n=1 Tax=Tagetes erecta TaxID=13708 RepID=A0AAD8K6G5_TARER|nr:hypothetical protein QVD17_26219 [Tagetes erecta]